MSCGIPVGSAVHVVKKGSKRLVSAEHFVGLTAGTLAGFLSGSKKQGPRTAASSRGWKQLWEPLEVRGEQKSCVQLPW